MMMLKDESIKLHTKEPTFSDFRRLVAKILLKYAEDSMVGGTRFTQRNIAEMIGADSRTVRASLKSLQDKGAIRLEHLRVIINKELLQKMAEYAIGDQPT